MFARPTVPNAEGWRPRKIWAFTSADEPSLTELMADPIFGHLLASDGVQQEHVETLITEMRYKLGYA
jgi:hypothetical protein